MEYLTIFCIFLFLFLFFVVSLCLDLFGFLCVWGVLVGLCCNYGKFESKDL